MCSDTSGVKRWRLPSRWLWKVNLVDAGEREHLEAARVGEDRPLPAGEPVQAAGGADDLEARAQVQVVGVAEDDPGVEGRRLELAGGHGLDRALGADRHEHRQRDRAARGVQPAGPGVAEHALDLEGEAGRGQVDSHRSSRVSSMASP
jgi:hypothetical protein